VTALLVAVAAVLGLAIGPLLTLVVARYATRRVITAPVLAAITAVAFAVVAWWMLGTAIVTGAAFWVVLVAYLYFAAISVALTVIDLDVRRLPNRIVLPSYLVAGILLVAACSLGAPWHSLLRAGIGMAALYAFYFVVRFISPRGMGGGDVKLAGVVGLYLGWASWAALAVGAFAAFLIGGVFGLVLIAVHRAGRKSAIPFGPWMIAGAWVGLLIGGVVGPWYVGLFGL